MPYQLRKRLPIWSGLAVRPRLRRRKSALGREALRRTPQADAVEHSLSAADWRELHGGQDDQHTRADTLFPHPSWLCSDRI